MAEREKEVGQRELAKIWKNVDPRTVRNWVKAGMPERRRSGQPVYRLSECIPWLIDMEAAKATLPQEQLDREREETLKVKAQRQREELKLQEELGELARTVDSERIWERTLSVCRSRITAARGKWAPKALGLGTMAEAAAFMDALIEDVLASLREGADEIEADDDVEEAA